MEALYAQYPGKVYYSMIKLLLTIVSIACFAVPSSTRGAGIQFSCEMFNLKISSDEIRNKGYAFQKVDPRFVNKLQTLILDAYDFDPNVEGKTNSWQISFRENAETVGRNQTEIELIQLLSEMNKSIELTLNTSEMRSLPQLTTYHSSPEIDPKQSRIRILWEFALNSNRDLKVVSIDIKAASKGNPGNVRWHFDYGTYFRLLLTVDGPTTWISEFVPNYPREKPPEDQILMTPPSTMLFQKGEVPF